MERQENIVYNGHGQMLDLFLPEGAFERVFLYFHGGGLTGGTREYQPFMGWLTDHGVAVVSASYRMYPQAKYPDFIEDAADAVSWARRRFPDKKLWVGGSSAGGYLSMMLCFDRTYLARRGWKAWDISGFIHNAGQPTTHFAVLEERGLDPRRIVVDGAAPVYHVGLEASYPPMVFVAAREDIPGRLEQLKMVLATMKHFGCDRGAKLEVLPGYHVAYDNAFDEAGDSVFGKIILSAMETQ